MKKMKAYWKYLFIAVAGMIITFNMTFVAYQDCSRMLGNRIYLICFSSFILFAVAILFNSYILIPRLLLKGKYLMYSIILGAVVLLLPTISIAQEYVVRNAFALPHRITSYSSPLILIDNLASSLTFSICFLGISAIAFLRQWSEQRTRMEQMEYEHLAAEINKLKGQITPAFLSRTLTQASASVIPNPKKATGMLMQLGSLLRYQLYDCNREQVLLSGEISFLRKFLSVEQMIWEGFAYEIRVEGDIQRVLVPPLLFVSFIQQIMADSTTVQLTFAVADHSFHFLCRYDGTKQPEPREIEAMERRLDLLYPAKYRLMQAEGKVELHTDISA